MLYFALNIIYSNFCYRKCQCRKTNKECKEFEACSNTNEDDCGKNGRCYLPDFGETGAPA